MAAFGFEGRVAPRGPGGAWCFLDFPKAASEKLGSRARVPVVVTINGVSIRTSAFPIGDGRHQVTVNKGFQKDAGIAPGARVRVRVEVDTRPRAVPVPSDLGKALAGNRAAKAAYDDLAPSHKKAYVDWIEQAKRPETRERRISDTLRRLTGTDPRFWD